MENCVSAMEWGQKRTSSSCRSKTPDIGLIDPLKTGSTVECDRRLHVEIRH